MEHSHLSRFPSLKETIQAARMRCASVKEICGRIESLWEDPERDWIIKVLWEKTLTEASYHELVSSCEKLAKAGESLNSRDRPRVDRLLKRILEVVPGKYWSELATGFLTHKRKTRRRITWLGLRRQEAPASVVVFALREFRRTDEPDMGQFVARNCCILSKMEDSIHLLDSLDDQYWRMRVLEGLLDTNRKIPDPIIKRFPWEFTYAVGRLQLKARLPKLRALLNPNREDQDFIGIYAWTLGKLGAIQDLNDLEQTIFC